MKSLFLRYAPILLMCLSACSKLQSQDKQAYVRIIKAMNTAVMQWNRGDLSGYMSLYAPDATMMMPNGRVGLDSIHGLYLKYYFLDGIPKQQLSYDSYQLTMLGKNYALLTGRFILKANNQLPERIGRFSVILVYRNRSWKLLHDHSG